MAKQTSHASSDKFASKGSSAGNSNAPTVVAGVLLVAYVVAAFFLPALPMIVQRLVGIVCALLAVVTYGFATRIIIPRGEILRQLKEGADVDEVHRALHPPRRSVRLPMLGDVTFRFLGGIGVFVLVAAWWFTPLAPIGVKRLKIEDLTVPFAQEIAGASLAFPGGTMATMVPPVVPSQVSELARRIDNDKDNSYYQGLKAIAEGRFGDARSLLADAAKTGGGGSAKSQLVRAQNEMFAGRFSDAAQQYAKLLETSPDDPMLLCQAAVARIQAGQYAEAEPLVEQIAKLVEEKLPEGDVNRGVCLHVLAVFDAVMASEGEGEKKCLATRKIVEKSPLGPKHPLMAASLNNQAVLYAVRANYADAQKAIDTSREICVESLPEEHLIQAVTLHGEAALRFGMGQYPDAQTNGEQALALGEKFLGIDNPNLIPLVDTLGSVYAAQALYIKAESQFLRAVRMGKAAWGPKHPSLIPPLCHLAQLYTTLKRRDEAKTACNEAFEIVKETLGERHPAMATVLGLRATIEIETGDPRDAGVDLEQALKIRTEELGKEHPDVIRTRANMAAMHNSPRTFGQGVTAYNKAIGKLEEHLGKTHPEVADLLFRVARIYFKQENFAKADACLKQAHAIQEKTLPKYHPKLAQTFDARAYVLAKIAPGDTSGAAALRAQAKAIRAEHAKINQPEVVAPD